MRGEHPISGRSSPGFSDKSLPLIKAERFIVYSSPAGKLAGTQAFILHRDLFGTRPYSSLGYATPSEFANLYQSSRQN